MQFDVVTVVHEGASRLGGGLECWVCQRMRPGKTG